MFLYETVASIVQNGYGVQDIPEEILSGLSPRITLRPYQQEALRHTLTYLGSQRLRGDSQVHLLYHMATGSGKTVVMAALMLHYYALGYRCVLFAVNQSNILAKTQENFLNPHSPKGLFATDVRLGGHEVPIRSVSNFAHIDPNGLNIRFCSMQKLHQDLFNPREDDLSWQDFEEHKVLLIADEAHHVNGRTKRGLSPIAHQLQLTWEDSVMQALRANRESVLLEFTATCDVNDPLVREKYRDKIIFNYPLSAFRESGYTKEFQNLRLAVPDAWIRTLGALLLSEYRRALFADCGMNMKPVVLLKSRSIQESRDFHSTFQAHLRSLTRPQLEELLPCGGYITEALHYFMGREIPLEEVCERIRLAFREEACLLMNSQSDISEAQMRCVNSLEEPNNPIRLIFTVDMLNEGWDVLNLYDIVRLYGATTGSARSPKTYTIKEAQLIGRGARYCPFAYEEAPHGQRKFDSDVKNPYRLLETLLFHSVDDSQYIHELQQVLQDNGLVATEVREVEYRLKESFQKSAFWQQGLVFQNQRVKRHHTTAASGLPDTLRRHTTMYRAPAMRAQQQGLFDSAPIHDAPPLHRTSYRMHEIPLPILLYASQSYEPLQFDQLRAHYPSLRSLREFLTSPAYAGEMMLSIESEYPHPSRENLYQGVLQLLRQVTSNMRNTEGEYEGSRTFTPHPLRKVLRNKVVRISSAHSSGIGVAQSVEPDKDLRLDVASQDWFIFTEHYGTDEEKAFVRWFDEFYQSKLFGIYDEVYLVRNERFPELALYNFNDGARFEPDFLLFLRRRNEGDAEFEQQQVYIEPKGEYLAEFDRWKEKLLMQLDEKAEAGLFPQHGRYVIVGAPFFNRNGLEGFERAIAALCEP